MQTFFRSIGIELKQAYGAVDAGGPLAVQADGDTATGTVGTALPGVELRLAENGEICVRAAFVPATATLNADGWLRTGDAGRLDGDRLVVVDRLADVLVVDGHDVSPSLVESWTRASPYIEDSAVFLADDGLAALVVVDAVTVGGWTETRRLHATSYDAMTRLPQVGELVADELARLNRLLPEGAAVRRCLLLPRRLDPDRGELTRTLLVRRRVVADHFADELRTLLQTPVPADPGGGTGRVHVVALPDAAHDSDTRTAQEPPA